MAKETLTITFPDGAEYDIEAVVERVTKSIDRLSESIIELKEVTEYTTRSVTQMKDAHYIDRLCGLTPEQLRKKHGLSQPDFEDEKEGPTLDTADDGEVYRDISEMD